MVLDRLVMSFARPAKAASGIGLNYFLNDPPLSLMTSNPQKRMADFQAVALRNRWIRAAERVISHAVGTVDWHLETDDGGTVTDESEPVLRAIRDLLEKPYAPLPGDPINQTPRTRSGLWSLTSRHQGVCGNGFWYLDQRDPLGIPLQVLYVNPARMTPVGDRLVGWVIDADAKGGGIPVKPEELLHFTLEEADSGWLAPGLVETALSSDAVTKFADRHAAQVLATGGKLPGVFSPKADAGTLPDEIFRQLEKELRAGMQGNDDGRRSFILKGPIDFTPTAATPEQLDLVAIQQMARDDVLELWGVPLSQLGGTIAAGLNSGATKNYDEAALWQKAVHPRLERMRETIQYQFLDPIGTRINRSLQLVIDEPTFDDDLPMFDIAQRAQYLPLRNSERRALIGYDPFGDDVLDNAVWMPATTVELAAAPVMDMSMMQGKAKVVHLPVRRAVNNMVPKIKKDIAAFLASQRNEIAAKVRAKGDHLAKKPTDSSVWWNGDDWDARLAKVLRPYAQAIADLTAKNVEAHLKPAGKAAEFADLAGNRALQAVLARVGVRITGINETTRDKVQSAIKQGIEDGLGAAALGDLVEESAAFDEYRAELIARTESNQVLNASQIESYREYDVTQVLAIDGDGDEECAARDGQTFALDDALDIQDHPNGTLDWSPVI